MVSELVGWCVEPSQPQRITLRLNTNFNLSPSYSFRSSMSTLVQTLKRLSHLLVHSKPLKLLCITRVRNSSSFVPSTSIQGKAHYVLKFHFQSKSNIYFRSCFSPAKGQIGNRFSLYVFSSFGFDWKLDLDT